MGNQGMKPIWHKAYFKASILFVLFIVAYWMPLKTMVGIWWTNEDYSYGFLIPVISAYLLWEKRRTLHEMRISNEWLVMPFLILFVLVSLYGVLGSSGNVAMPSLPILIILFTAFCFGRGVVRRLLLPLGFLFFMVPVPNVIERTLGLMLKSIASHLSGWVIRLFGITVHVSGNVIDLGVTQLQVVDACSGLRYLFPLCALGVLYAYFFEGIWWKRVASVLATLPIAVVTNVIRVSITGVLASKYGSKTADGFFHGFSGWAIFLVAFVLLFLFGRVLRFFPPKGRPVGEPKPSEAGGEVTLKHGSSNIKPAFLTSVGLLLIVAILSWSTKALPPVTIQGGITSFPLTIKGWQGQIEYIDPDIIIRSGAEDSFSGLYRNSSKDEISLYIGYRSTAFLATENFFHSPEVCLPAAGWKIKKQSIHTIEEVPPFGNLKVAKLVMEYMGSEQLVYYWFQTKNKASYDKNINRFHLALHAITRDNTYDLFIRPIMPLRPDEKIEEAEKRMDQFVREMMDTLIQFINERQVK